MWKIKSKTTMISVNHRMYFLAMVLLVLFNIIALHKHLTNTDKEISDESFLPIHDRNTRVKLEKLVLKRKKVMLDGPSRKVTHKIRKVTYKIDKMLVSKLARSFKSKQFSSWCTPASEFNKSSPTGILYTRVPKTGSSTVSGVLERISQVYGRNNAHIGKCAIQYKHLAKKVFKYRDEEMSYMIGSIRNPAKRAISRVFFQDVSKLGKEPTDENILKALRKKDKEIGVVTHGKGGFQLEYLSIMSRISKNAGWAREDDGKKFLNMTYIEESVQWIMDNYQFIFLNERLDEGLIALHFLLNLRTNDMLYLSSKVNGGSYYRWGNNTKSRCIKLQKSFVSPAVGEYLSSPIWIEKNYGDYLLHAVVNKSIDLTIDNIGKERFDEALDTFRTMKRVAEDKCASAAIPPCSSIGEYQPESAENCYFEDIGCGYGCLDDIQTS